MDIPTLEQITAKIENEMSIPSMFLNNLLKEDDWSFVIKSHAFLEALLTFALVESFQRYEVRGILERLDMSDAKVGKIKFAAALGLIKKDGERFLRELSKLRNDLVHEVKNLGFSFAEYISALDKNQKKTFVISLSYFASDEDIKDRYEIVRDLMLNDTKRAIWLGLLHFTGNIYWSKELNKQQLLSRVLSEEIRRLESNKLSMKIYSPV